MKRSIIHRSVLAVLLAATAIARAQVNSGLDEVCDPTGESSRLLGPEYKDEAAEFRLTVPVGSRIIQRANLELVSFVVDSKQWSGNLQASLTAKEIRMDEFLKTLAADQAKVFRAVQVRKSEVTKFKGRTAGELVTSVEALVDKSVPGTGRPVTERVLLFRQILVVQLAPDRFQVLAFNTPLKDKESAEKTWAAMLERYEVLDRAQVAERRRLAVETGRKWFAERSAEELKEKLNKQPQIFRITIDNGDVGYVVFDEFEGKRDGMTGVLAEMTSRTFPPNNTVIMAATSTFWSYKDPKKEMPHYSNWTSGVKNVAFREIVAGQGERQFVGWQSELGILQRRVTQALKDVVGRHGKAEQIVAAKRDEGYWLNVTLSEKDVKFEDRDTRKPPPAWEITAEQPSPLPKVLEFAWPRLVDLEKPSSMAFVVYNATTRRLGLRTLSVIGPAVVMLDGKRTECIKLTDELDPGTTTLWVDKSGKVLMMRSSDQTVLTPTTEDRMKQLWSRRLDKINTTPLAETTIINQTPQPGQGGILKPGGRN